MTRTVRCPLSGRDGDRIVLVVVCSVTLSASNLSAITWEFTEEEAATTSPWTAWQGDYQQGEEIYDTQIDGGSWIIDIPELWVSGREFSERVTPSLEILSPIIGHDTALFDQVRVRARFVTDTPFLVGPRLAWNEHLWYPGWGTLMFLDNPIVADGSWQEFTFDLRKAEEGTWSGELRDFHVALRLDPGESGGNVRSVEVDRIILTGFEEQLRGELSPPPLEAGAPPGLLLEEARFTSLGLIGVGASGGLPGHPVAVLEDFDGDGTLDLATAWWRFGSGGAGTTVDTYGWLTAMGDGLGQFQSPWVSEAHDSFFTLLSGDTDGNGSAEVVRTSYPHTQILRSRSGLWELAGELQGIWLYSLADGDGDGDLDLLAQDYQVPFHGLMMNDGTGRFDAMVDLSPRGGRLTRGVANACGGGRLGALWAGSFSADLDSPAHFLVTCLDEDGEVAEMPLHSGVDRLGLRFVGDLDGDHDIDLLADANWRYGPDDLLIVTNTGDGTMVEETLDEGVQVRSVWVGDLDMDGRLDILFVDAGLRSPALVVYTGKDGGQFALEGRYPLAGLGSEVLAGDLNGDAWPDVVVLVPSAKGTGGAHTFLNRGVDSDATSVESGDLGPRPVEFSTISVYPNPFNSNVVIRLTKAGLHEDPVSMRVYNVAGQPVRSLARGVLAAGTHEVLWDGRTDQGEPVSSGVYLLRVEFEGRSLVQKMLVAR